MPEKQLTFSTIREKLIPVDINKPITLTPHGYTCAAVAIPLTIIDQEIYILFTKRTAMVRDHQNQISFPGGVCEIGDRSYLDTALREVEEEIAIQIPPEAILGALEPRKTVTGYFITPFIAIIPSLEKMKPNPAEVEKVLQVPLIWLADSKNHAIRPYQRIPGEMHDVVFFSPYQGEII